MNTITLIDGSNQFIFEDLSGMAGFEYPQVINAIGDISGRGGAVYLASKFGRRLLSWQGLLRNDVPENRRALELACKAGRLKTIKFETCDGLSVQAQIEVDRLTMPYKLGRTKCLIEATAPDWRFFSQVTHSTSTSETLILGGFDIPADIPMDILRDEASVVPVTINNAGTEYSDPLFTIQGPGRRFIIKNKTTGEEFTIVRTLTATDTITIYTNPTEILLNGVTPIYSSLQGDLWKVQPGESEIGFFAVGSGPTTLLTIAYPDAFLGI